MNKVTKSYKSSAVNTASPGQLVLMLFDGALKFIEQARVGTHLENFRERNEVVNNNLIKAQNILSELQTSLDMKVPGDFSKTMFALYDYMIRQLQEANMQKTEEPIKVVARLLRDIRDAWEEMLRNSPTNTSATDEQASVQAKKRADDENGKVGGGLNVSA
jgi:flagellar protein FliS